MTARLVYENDGLRTFVVLMEKATRRSANVDTIYPTHRFSALTATRR